MSLVAEYQQQQRWRDWDRYLDRLPIAPGQLVWDVGAGVGEVAAKLAHRGARVVAVDSDERMLEALAARRLHGVELQAVDLTTGSPAGEAPIDGIWCGFSLAYFVDAAGALGRWTDHLRRLAPGAWIAVLEIDRLFSGHAPLPAAVARELATFELEMERAGHYDFRMGSKVPAMLDELGFDIVLVEQPSDPELSFTGPAPDEILVAWRRRLERMKGMRARLGARFEPVRDAFLSCLQSDEHTCSATLWFTVGRLATPPPTTYPATERS